MSDTLFPEMHNDELIARMENGPESVIAFIQSFEDAESRRKLYSLAQKTFGSVTCERRDLDALISVVRGGIHEGLRQFAAESDRDLADKFKNFSSVLSYNLAADLAECWPEDDLPREPRHFQAGLNAANDCLKWRVELRKGPYPFSIAWWARGIHEMSLGLFDEATDSFEKATDYGIQAAHPVGSSHDVDSDFNVLLNRGFGGLAARLGNHPVGEAKFAAACELFAAIARTGEGEAKRDAAFGLAQLECAAKRITAERLAQPV